MTRDLDDLLGRLAATPDSWSLDGMEPLVWRRVEALRSERLMSQLRVGAVAVALATGLARAASGPSRRRVRPATWRSSPSMQIFHPSSDWETGR